MLILKAQGHSDTAIGAKYGASQRTVAHQLKQFERDIVKLFSVVAPVVKQALDNHARGGAGTRRVSDQPITLS
jgi:hypothetical protein